MRNYHNLEASGFKPGQFIGYAEGAVYRVRKIGDRWQATPLAGNPGTAFTRDHLAQVSAALQAIGDRRAIEEGSKSPGQRAYEADVEKRPTYSNGRPRAAWHDLSPVARWSWDKPEPFPATIDVKELA